MWISRADKHFCELYSTLVVSRVSISVQFWQRVRASKHTWKNCFSEIQNAVRSAIGLQGWSCVWWIWWVVCKLCQSKGSVLSTGHIEEEGHTAYLFYFAVPATAVEQCGSQRSEQHGDLKTSVTLCFLRFLQWRREHVFIQTIKLELTQQLNVFQYTCHVHSDR